MSDTDSSHSEDVVAPTPAPVAERPASVSAMAQFDEAMAPHLDRLSVGPVNEHHLVSLVTALRGALASALAFLSGETSASTPAPEVPVEPEPETPVPADPPADPPPAPPSEPAVTAPAVSSDVEDVLA